MAPHDDDEGAAVAVPDTGEQGESGKLKMIVSLVKKVVGVKDIASMRLSLPASLLEPIPNLEYWHYLDRPDLFVAINDSDDPFERMLAVLRFTFSKDLRHARGKPCKPYNSVLGEHFRSHWDILPVSYPSSDMSQPPQQHLFLSTAAPSSVLPSRVASPAPKLAFSSSNASAASDTASIRSERSTRPASVFSVASKAGGNGGPSTAGTSVESNLEGGASRISLAPAPVGPIIETDDIPNSGPRVRIAFLTEQISHHPPVSAYYASCPTRGLTLCGIDQIAARVSGTAIRVGPGELNKGIFVKIEKGNGKGEGYRISHPTAAVNGLLRGSPYVAMGESTVISCEGGAEGEKLRAVLEYKEESWIGRAVYHVEGVIFAYTPGDGSDEWTRVKHVPKAKVLAQVDGSWRHLIRWRRTGETEWTPLLDLSTLHAVPMTVRDLGVQGEMESRRMWEPVTSRLERKEFGEATKYKQVIEQKQRDDAAERKRKGVEFMPAYFEKDIASGQPVLTAEGRKALEGELAEPSAYTLETAEAVVAS